MDFDDAIEKLTITGFTHHRTQESSGWVATVLIEGTTPVPVAFEKWGSDNYSHQEGDLGLGDEINEAVWEILETFANEYLGRLVNYESALFEELSDEEGFAGIIESAGYNAG